MMEDKGFTMAAQEKRKEFCAVLGVDEGASKVEIKEAYKKLALQCHPDKNGLNPQATKEFQRVSEAYTGLCQGDDFFHDEDDIDGAESSVSELLQMFFKSYQQNFWNCSTQPTWNEDWQVPGNTRLSSSSSRRGNAGRNRGRKRNNIRKNTSSQEYSFDSREASCFNNSGGSPVSVGASECPDVKGDDGVGFCDGDSVAREASSDGLMSDTTIENQDCDEIYNEALQINQKEEEMRKKKEEKDKTKLVTQFTACKNPLVVGETENSDSLSLTAGVEQSCTGSQVVLDMKTDVHCYQEEQLPDHQSFDSPDRIADGSECNQESIETSSFEGTNDEGKGSSECLNDIGSEKAPNYKRNPGKPFQTERPTFSRVFYGHSGYRYSNKNAARSSEQFLVKNSADKAKVEGAHFRPEPDGYSFGDHCSNGNLKKDFGSCTNSFSLSGFNQPRSHFNNRCPKDNVFKNFDRQLHGGSGKCDQADNFRAPVTRLEDDGVRSEIKVSTSKNPEFADDDTLTARDRNYRYQRYAHSLEGQRYRFNRGGRQNGFWPRCHKQNGNEGGSCGFDGGGGGGGIDGSSQKHLGTSVEDEHREKHLRCAETEAGDHLGLAKDQNHSGDVKHDQNNFRPDYGGRGRNRGYNRAGIRPDNAYNRNAGRKQYAQDYSNYGKKHYGTNSEPIKYPRGDDGGSGDGFSGKTLEFYRRKTTSEDRNCREQNMPACSHPQRQLNSEEPATEIKAKEPVHSTSFAATSQSAPVKNVWKDRQEFYEGALPKSKEEEDEMLEAALKLSQLDVEGELIQSSADIDSNICSSSTQIDYNDEQVAVKRLHSWADEMEEIVDHSPPSSSSFSESDGRPSQSARCSESKSSAHCDQYNVPDGRTTDEDQRLAAVVTVGLEEHSCFVPGVVVSSAAENTTCKAVDLPNAAGGLTSSTGLKRDSLEPELLGEDAETKSGSCGFDNLETLQTHATPVSDKNLPTTDDGPYDVPSDPAEESIAARQQSMLDYVDDCGREDEVLGQSLSELSDASCAKPPGLFISDSNCLETNEFLCDSLENKDIGMNSYSTDLYPSVPAAAGYLPQMLPSGYPYIPPYLGSMPWLPCHPYWPYMVPAMSMMPVASQLPSHVAHSQAVNHCMNEVQLPMLSDLPDRQQNFCEDSHLSQPPLVAPVFPFGFNPHGINMAAFNFPMPGYLPMHVPLQHRHPAPHGEINCPLETESAADEK